MVMSEIIKTLSDKANSGSWVLVQEFPGSDVNIQYELGGLLPIKDNWIVYFPPYPYDQQDLHDSLIGRFEEIDRYSVSYLDQIGRKIIFMSFEPFETEQIDLVKKWQKELKKGSEFLDGAVRDRLEFPQNYLGGQFSAKD